MRGTLLFFKVICPISRSHMGQTRSIGRSQLSNLADFCLVLKIVTVDTPKLVCDPLQWCHNEHNDISNHQRPNCLVKCLFRHRSKKTSKLGATGLCEGNSLVTGEFPVQRASNMENASIWWRHHAVTRRYGDSFYCGLVKPYGIIELGQNWLNNGLLPWWPQTISWTNLD